MGIPYYFVSLVRAHKGIVSRVHATLTPDILAIDFNCFIHQYLDDTNPIESIVVALRDLLTNTCKATKHVYIGMDGLVPYGKIVQQRYRRFRIPEKTPVFDRHQISPGTPYMKELATAVKAAFPSALVSDTSEPGEGEHKLLAWLKTIPTTQRRSITVYGLDADLILLCLVQKELSNPYGFNLLRENTTFNSEKPGFSTMSVWKLADKVEIPLIQYLWLSVLCFGNDFMPSLAMFSLREGGHERAMQVYAEAASPDLTTTSGRGMFMKVAARHEMRILKEKVQKRNIPGERAIVTVDAEKLRERYNLHILDGVRNVKPVVDAYWKTAYWTMQYFTTNETPCWAWVYPYADAPLVCQLVDHLPPAEEKAYTHPGAPPFTITNQLQCILPSASLRTCKKRVLFPDEFYNEETDTRMPWMKRYAWEARPRISQPWAVTETQTKISAWTWEQ